MLEVIGRGGMGVVYKARHIGLDRFVAVKFLSPERAADPAFAERFAREARTQAKLNHPHIVTIHDVGEAAGSVYILMEYVEGASLRDMLLAGRITPEVALNLVPQLCDAIQYAHDRGVVHRDIKPENVLITRDGGAKIADFGLAKSDSDAFKLTGLGERMGTAGYMAPEQWADSAKVDHRADIYSLGVLIYEMLTGDLPGLQCKPPSAKAGTSLGLDRVVARSLCEEPGERYQQAAEIKTDIQRLASLRQRQRVLVGIACALLIAILVVLLVIAVWPTKRPPGNAQGDPPPVPPTRTPIPSEILTSPNWEWTQPENLGPGVNTEHRDQSPCISADGLVLLLASDRPDGHGDMDLWECRRANADQAFGNLVNLGPTVNGPDPDTDPCLSGDGLTLVFVSKRGGQNHWDIWWSRRKTTAEPWAESENLGVDVNSDSHEFRPWLSHDGLRLTFNSLRPPREGVWVSRRATSGDAFGVATPFCRNHDRLALGGVSFSADGRVVLCHRFDSKFPGNLMWIGRIDNPSEPFKNLISFGPVVNADAIDTVPVASTDGRTVYFQSDRPGGHGGSDIWQTRRVPRP